MIRDNCDVCIANKYELWTKTRLNPNWPKKVKLIFKKLRRGDAITIKGDSK